jgi:hypothetical protein
MVLLLKEKPAQGGLSCFKGYYLHSGQQPEEQTAGPTMLAFAATARTRTNSAVMYLRMVIPPSNVTLTAAPWFKVKHKVRG